MRLLKGCSSILNLLSILNSWSISTARETDERTWHSFGWNNRFRRSWSYWERMGDASMWDAWSSCKMGRLQSPVNISTENLVFDKSLTELKINGSNVKLSVVVGNTGQDVYIQVDPGIVVTFSGGPLSYKYQFFGALIKFGSHSRKGSDHLIDNKSFPGELQLYAFNSELYSNHTVAMDKPHGLAALAVLFVISESQKNTDMSGIVVAAEKTKFKGDTWPLAGIELQSLLPSFHHYMTYEGSMTFPGCHETVTWIVLNQPIKMPETELKTLRSIKSENDLRLSNNFRQIQPINNRSIRTNIRLQYINPSCENPSVSEYSANIFNP